MNKTFMNKILVLVASFTAITGMQPVNANQHTMSIFATSVGSGRGAGLGGLEVADAHCTKLVETTGIIGKTWRAYLSTQDRFYPGVESAKIPSFYRTRLPILGSNYFKKQSFDRATIVEQPMHYHLDPVGGIAGDMFAAAMLDYRPEWQGELAQVIRDSGLAADLDVHALAYNDGILAGHRFEVQEPSIAGEHHRHWLAIRRQLVKCTLAEPVKQRAVAIFTQLAEAEAEVHGCEVKAVTFHELGAWDSIADIVAAAWLIERSDAAGWSCSPIPLGRGRVATAHGSLPLPAPATLLLLRGMPVFDDGVEGERVTPTGAAILKHLAPDFGPRLASRVLIGQGYGFGSKRFPALSNLLRVSAFDPDQSPGTAERIVQCRFEVDDQTPEDLAVGLERLRSLPGVLDIVQAPVFGKKGRIAMQVQVLGELARIDAVLDHCLSETTTLGVRWQIVNKKMLAREVRHQATPAGEVRVKHAKRPDGTVTCKVDMDDLANAPGGHAGREQRRREVCEREQSSDSDTSNDRETSS